AQRSSAASGKGRGMPRCRPVSACQRPSAINRRLRSPFARRDGDLPLLKAFKGAILTPEIAGIWRMSVYSQNMLEIAVELAAHQPAYEDLAGNFSWPSFYRSVAP